MEGWLNLVSHQDRTRGCGQRLPAVLKFNHCVTRAVQPEGRKLASNFAAMQLWQWVYNKVEGLSQFCFPRWNKRRGKRNEGGREGEYILFSSMSWDIFWECSPFPKVKGFFLIIIIASDCILEMCHLLLLFLSSCIDNSWRMPLRRMRLWVDLPDLLFQKKLSFWFPAPVWKGTFHVLQGGRICDWLLCPPLFFGKPKCQN